MPDKKNKEIQRIIDETKFKAQNRNTDEHEEDETEQLDDLVAYLIELVLENDKYDLSKIEAAFRFAKEAHEGQTRSTGQPYITHPVSVATILIKELGMDTDSVCAGILHDVIEDTDYQFKDIKNRFGQDVAMLVDGCTKIANVPLLTKDEIKGEAAKKLMLAMSHDIRVLIVKLADRLHNIRTLKFCREDKRRRIALETLYIYTNLADRIGMRAVKEELEDLSFRYLDPYAVQEIEYNLEMKKNDREKFIDDIKRKIKLKFNEKDFIREPFVDGRVKSIYGLWKKSIKQNKTIEEIYDRYAVRIIVTTKEECYNVLGMVHDMFTPIPNRFKDYISIPKENGYQSIHTTVIGEEQIPFEVQIRTWEMHETAEYGVAAHWKYKEGISGRDKMEESLAWIRKTLEIGMDTDNANDILDVIKNDIGAEEVVVVTPKGKAITLPQGSTALDFAYRIHTEIGHKTIGVKVDAKIQRLDYVLKTGQIVEIMAGKTAQPKKDWLDFVKTNEAKSKIRSWFKQECRPENIIAGKERLHKEFIKYKIVVPDDQLVKFLESDMRKHSCSSIDDFYALIGYGGIVIENIMPRLRDEYAKQYADLMAYYDAKIKEYQKSETPTANSKDGVIVENLSGVETRFAKCCNPLPGDHIVGFVTRAGYIAVHKNDCENYIRSVNTEDKAQRWHPLDWSITTNVNHDCNIEITALDRIGLNLDITQILVESRINIVQFSSRVLKDRTVFFEATINIKNVENLELLFGKLRSVKDVISVNRK